MSRIRYFLLAMSTFLSILLTMGLLFCPIPALAENTPSAGNTNVKPDFDVNLVIYGNMWKRAPSDAEINQAFEAFKKRDQEKELNKPPVQQTFPYDLVKKTYAYGAPEKVHSIKLKDQYPEKANHVVVKVTLRIDTTTVEFDHSAQKETRRMKTDTLSYYADLLPDSKDGFAFEHELGVTGASTLTAADRTLLYASGWVSKNALKLTGTLTDAKGRPMAYMLGALQAGNNKEVLIEIGENGRYEYSLEMPENPSEADRKVVLKLAFNYRKNKLDWMSMYQNPKPASNPDIIILVNTYYIPQGYKEKEFAKAISFATADNGYISSTDNTPDAIITNIGDVKKLKDYSIAYVDFHEAMKFASENLRVNFSQNIPLKLEMEATEPTAYNYKVNTIRLEKSELGDNSAALFTLRHEFGHYLQYTAYGKKWPANAASEGDTRNVSHGGYANDDTGDSFIEGFATYYAALVGKYKENPDRDPGVIGNFDNLDNEWLAWGRDGTDEELAFAAVLWDLTTKANIPYPDMWDVLKSDRYTFTRYYETFIDRYKEKKQYIQSRYIVHGIYAIRQTGNQTYDVGEPYIDQNNNQQYDQGEHYIDLSIDPATGAQNMGPRERMNIGQSSNYQRIDKRYSTYRFPNSYLKVNGAHSDTLKVRILRQDGSEYSYTTPVYQGRIYVGLPPKSLAGKLYVMDPGESGSQIHYENTLQEMNKKFENTRSADSMDSLTIKEKSGTLGVVDASKGTDGVMVWAVAGLALLVVVAGLVLLKKKKK